MVVNPLFAKHIDRKLKLFSFLQDIEETILIPIGRLNIVPEGDFQHQCSVFTAKINRTISVTRKIVFCINQEDI